jgi:hypothetical protein
MASSVKISHYTIPQSELNEQKCVLCSELLDGIGVGHTSEKVHEFFHQACFFKHCEEGNNFCPLCKINILQPEENLSFYYLFPRFSVSYPNTFENQELVAEKISRMWAFFLMRRAHEGEMRTELDQLGIDVVAFHPDHQYVSAEKVQLFIQNLKNVILTELSKKKKVDLTIGLSPVYKGPIREALDQSQIEWGFFQCCFPYKTNALIKKTDTLIEVDVRLNSSFGSRWEYRLLPRPRLLME